MTKISRPLLLGLSISIISAAGAFAQTTSALPAYENPNVPGATGDTVVRGNNSTITGNRDATLRQRYFQQSVGQEADRTDHPAPSKAPVAVEQH